MRQLPLAALNFESAIGLLPTGHELISGTGNPNDPFSNDPTSNGWGWRTKILPYMDQGNLNTLFDLTLPIADPVNRELAETVIPNFSCPSVRDQETIALTSLTRRQLDFAIVGNGISGCTTTVVDLLFQQLKQLLNFFGMFFMQVRSFSAI